MTTPDQENEFQALLRQHADGVEVSGDFAPVAIARRRRDQRTRAALGAAAAVAVIAVAVPTVWSAGRGTAPVPALTTSTTSLPSSSTSSVPTEGAPTTTGAAPSATTATRDTAYALDDTIRFGDTVVGLEKGTVVETFAVLANGGFLLQSHQSTGSSQSEMEILSPTGRTVASLGLSGMYAVSPDGSYVIAKSGDANGDTIVVYAADGSKVAQRTDARDVGAIVGDVAYLTGDATRGSLEWNVATGATRALPGPRRRGVAGPHAGSPRVVRLDRRDGRGVLGRRRPDEAVVPQDRRAVWSRREPDDVHADRVLRAGAPTSSARDYVDGGFWFSAGVVRASDGSRVLGGTGDRVVSGWTWHLGDDESTFTISRNTSTPLSPATEQHAPAVHPLPGLHRPAAPSSRCMD